MFNHDSAGGKECWARYSKLKCSYVVPLVSPEVISDNHWILTLFRYY